MYLDILLFYCTIKVDEGAARPREGNSWYLTPYPVKGGGLVPASMVNPPDRSFANLLLLHYSNAVHGLNPNTSIAFFGVIKLSCCSRLLLTGTPG